MRFYGGSFFVKEAEKNLNLGEVLFCSKDMLLLSAKPCKRISLKRGGSIFLWGEVYAVRRSNGTYCSVNMETDNKTVLKELFENNTIEKFLELIEGNFIGVFISGDSKAVVFADVFNRTEIFYTLEKKGTILSIDLEPVLKGVKKLEYSQAALSNMLTIYGYYAPKKHTIYESIKRFGVGERLIFDRGVIKIEQFSFIPCRIKPFDERKHDEYANILNDAVRIRGSAACNWVLLSSGWDSTSLLAMLVKQRGPSKVRAVIGKMRYSDRSGTINQFELDRAKKVADYYGVQLDVVPLDLRSQDCVDYWKELRTLLRRQHIYAPAAYNFSRLSDYFQKNAGPQDSIFAGEISDGAHNLGFAQFATILEHPDLGFREYSDKMNSYLFSPSFFNRILNNNYCDDAVYKLLRQRAGKGEFDDKGALSDKSRRIKYFSSFFLRNKRIPFYGLHNTKLLTKKGAEKYESEMAKLYLAQAAMKATPETLYSWILYLYNSFHWQGSTVRMISAKLEDKGRKIKLPFWDGRLQHFLSEMPEDWGRGLELRPTKYPLKYMLQNNIDYPLHLQTGPHSYLYDVNPQFSHSSEILFGSYLSQYLKELLKSHPYEELLHEDVFNLQYLRKIVDAYKNGIELVGAERNDLMSIATLCLTGWY